MLTLGFLQQSYSYVNVLAVLLLRNINCICNAVLKDKKLAVVEVYFPRYGLEFEVSRIAEDSKIKFMKYSLQTKLLVFSHLEYLI